MHDSDHIDEDGYVIRPNKSELKRQAQAQLELGEKLVDLDKQSLNALGLPNELVGAVSEAKAIHSHSARKRQLKLIGKLLRGIETGELEQWIANREQLHRKGVNEFHEVEKWRDKLIADGIAGGASAMSEFLSLHPDVDRQRLNQLIRGAVREASMEKPPKSSRQLFKYLKEIM